MSKVKISLGVVGIVLLSLVGAYIFLDRETSELNKATIKSFGNAVHQFASLKHGRTHYQWSGGTKGHIVVQIHGVSGPMSVWDKTYPTLVKAGFRVLRLDLYGRGLSARPNVPYTLALYRQQLQELLAQLKIKGPITVMGSSMGAIVSLDLARHATKQVEKLILVGPAGFPLKASILAKLIHIPGIGDYMMRVVGHKKLMEHNFRYFYKGTQYPAFLAAFERQLRIKGSKRAILSTMRNVPVQGYLHGYRAVGKMKKPVLIIWGKQDPAFPYPNHKKALAAIPHARLITVNEAGHLPQFEQPTQVNQAILSFLK